MSNRRREAIYLNTSAGSSNLSLHTHTHTPQNSQGNSENVNENENSIFHLNADTASILKMLSPLPVAIVVVVVKSATSLSMLKRCCRRLHAHRQTHTHTHRYTCVPHGTIQVPSAFCLRCQRQNAPRSASSSTGQAYSNAYSIYTIYSVYIVCNFDSSKLNLVAASKMGTEWDELMSAIVELQLGKSWIVLGLKKSADRFQIIYHSVHIINYNHLNRSTYLRVFNVLGNRARYENYFIITF